MDCGGGVWGVGGGRWEWRAGAPVRIATGSAPTPHSPPATPYCDGTYVGSCVTASITDPYAVTRPVPLITFTVTRTL